MEITTSWQREGRKEGLQQGLRRETELVLRLLKKKIGNLNKIKEQQIFSLPIEKIEELGEALLDFKDEKDVESWLTKISK